MTDDETESDSDEDDNDDNDGASREGYNLRTRQPVDYAESAMLSLYACMAQSDMIKPTDEPKVSAAMKSKDWPLWVKGIIEEFDTLEDNDTWEVIDYVPVGTRVLPAAVILKVKRDANGRPVRFKARLVVRGNLQSDPVDYTELYAPVACIELVRVLLSVAVSLGWDIELVDVKGAFLHALLPKGDVIYVRLPKLECLGSLSGQIVKLKKSLYGLRQAPKLWYQHLSQMLSKKGFRRSMSSDCFFVADLPTGPVYLVVYVDDLLIFGSKENVSSVKKTLADLFTVTDLGECKYFLGIKIDRSPNGLFLSQRAYTERLINAAGMTDAKPKRTPLPLAHKLYEKPMPTTDADKLTMRGKPYREILGALLYLSTRTRPDIATAVSLLGKFQADPGPTQWKHLLHVVRYLIHTPEHELFIKSNNGQPRLEAYSDADWARDESNRRSRSGYLLLINSAPIIWSSKLQPATAQSTSEAEFAALQACVREVDWVRGMLKEIGHAQRGPTTVYQDNLGTISWTDSVQGLRKVKHVGVRYHYVRSKVEDCTVKVLYTPSLDNKADSLTKVLGPQTFENHRDYLGVVCQSLLGQ